MAHRVVDKNLLHPSKARRFLQSQVFSPKEQRMSAAIRFSVFFAICAVALFACPPTPPVPDAGPSDAGANCFEPADCPDPHLFFCNMATSLCEPACHTKDDCLAAARGTFA